MQLAHAGRKGSSRAPWEGGAQVPLGEPGSWPAVAPSALPHSLGEQPPIALDAAGMAKIRADFARAATRAARLGIDGLEIHAAHGYLLHQFLSPLANQRKDEYGKNRMKAPLEIAQAVREVWPKERALGARISGNDWMEGGLGPDDAVAYARELKKIGYDYVCVSSGAMSPLARMKVEPGYQVPFAERVKKNAGIAVRAVGMIADAQQAEDIIASGKADMVAMARAFLDDPRWVWHAAEHFGVQVDYPPQYARSRYDLWPGAAVARPRGAR
jgi:NADPH2 dehydrogenase